MGNKFKHDELDHLLSVKSMQCFKLFIYFSWVDFRVAQLQFHMQKTYALTHFQEVVGSHEHWAWGSKTPWVGTSHSHQGAILNFKQSTYLKVGVFFFCMLYVGNRNVWIYTFNPYQLSIAGCRGPEANPSCPWVRGGVGYTLDRSPVYQGACEITVF